MSSQSHALLLVPRYAIGAFCKLDKGNDDDDELLTLCGRLSYRVSGWYSSETRSVIAKCTRNTPLLPQVNKYRLKLHIPTPIPDEMWERYTWMKKLGIDKAICFDRIEFLNDDSTLDMYVPCYRELFVQDVFTPNVHCRELEKPDDTTYDTIRYQIVVTFATNWAFAAAFGKAKASSKFTALGAIGIGISHGIMASLNHEQTCKNCACLQRGYNWLFTYFNRLFSPCNDILPDAEISNHSFAIWFSDITLDLCRYLLDESASNMQVVHAHSGVGKQAMHTLSRSEVLATLKEIERYILSIKHDLMNFLLVQEDE